MAYYTLGQMRSAAKADMIHESAGSQLRHSARSGPYDIFLSHSFQDAEVILGIKRTLERTGQSVYVDWAEDPHLSRQYVTKDTARRLRDRMRQSTSFIFATSSASPDSKWMPWELGYFDGLRDSESIAIMPIVDYRNERFVGQEYLGLYPQIEDLPMRTSLSLRVPTVARRIGESLETRTLTQFARGERTYSRR